MVREIQNIEQDLNDLETQVDTIAEKLEQTYQEYTETLGDTLKQQLVFSVYQICTQEYPNGFLNLSLSQQQGLQRKIRELAEQAKENLQLGGEVLQKMDFQTDNEESDEDDENPDESNQLLSEQWETFSKDEENTETSVNQDILKELLDSNEQNSDVETQANSPENLLNWSKLQEDAIAMILENVSSQANETLRKTGVLPKEFPKEMIDAALQAEGAGSMSHNAPGVIHLMLELERKNQQQKNEDSNDVIQLAIIRLRVGEMEFAAPSLNMKRRELRQLGQQLQQLQEQYNKLTKERAIAQAELAWRSSWQQDEA